jgi:hypothetical protein
VPVISALKVNDYFIAREALAKRFAPFQDSAKTKLLTDYHNLRISSGQTFRKFYGKIQDIVHKLAINHNVQMIDDMIIHKITSNIPGQLKVYYFTIKDDFLSPDHLALKLSSFEDQISTIDKEPETVQNVSEKSPKGRYNGICGNCGRYRHRREECNFHPRAQNEETKPKSENSRRIDGARNHQNQGDRANFRNKGKSSNSKYGPSNKPNTNTSSKNFNDRKRKVVDLSDDADHHHRAYAVTDPAKGISECLICHQRNNHSHTNCPYGQMTIQVENAAMTKHDQENDLADKSLRNFEDALMIAESVLPCFDMRKIPNVANHSSHLIGSVYGSSQVVVDTGASRSMFRDRTLFDNYTLISDTYVYTANGKPLEVVGKGSVGFIPDCYHVPALSRDLLSIPHLDATLGALATFSKGIITISSNTQRFPTLKGTLNPQNMLYELPIAHLVGRKRLSNTPQNTSHVLLLQSKAEAVNRLHDIFHRDSRRLEQMIKDGVITWDAPYKPTNFVRMESDCDACRIAKSTRKPFTGHITPETQIGKLWYFDMWGPNETASIKGNTYIAGFIEAVTKKVFLYYVPNKKCAAFTRHLVTTEIPVLRHRHGLKDFIIQSDTGEFVSQEVEAILSENGGALRHGSPYTPETQAVIERLWRTVTELATTMLIAAQLPEPYWEDATEYARLIYNRTIRSTGSPDIRQSPEEMYTSSKPSMKHYQPFGCKAYLHIPKSVRRKNHKGRAELGIFIGFDEQTYPGYKFLSSYYIVIMSSQHTAASPSGSDALSTTSSLRPTTPYPWQKAA